MKSNTKSNGKQSTKSETTTSASHDDLHKLFEDGIKDLYWAEKNLLKALPKMVKNASSSELVQALEGHLAETEVQVTRLEEVFASIDAKPVAKKCEAMEGLIKEGEEIMKDSEPGVMMDAGIIAAGQKVEHYEIASYGTLATYAEILGYTEAAGLLRETLEEEKAADEKLTAVTASAVLLTESEVE
ncbi:hypothetical protein CAP36_09740 [Chitinophagaceae bacterium IBVUCB2]|nr:hypothetical protein CAP36_09740 [Chitinophagaceae bacterium IBVUCB2]